MTPSVSSTKPNTSTPRALWFGLLAGPIVWSLYFLLGYGLVELACRSTFLNGSLLGLRVVVVVEMVLMFLTLAVTLYAGAVAYRNWRRFDDQKDQNGDETGNGIFMAFAGLMLSGLVVLLTLAIGLPLLFLGC